MEFVVALISAASVSSRWAQHEIRLAMTSGLSRERVNVLPMRVGDTPVPGELAGTFCAPLDPSNMSAGLASLVADIVSHHEDRQRAEAAGEPLPTTGAVAPAAKLSGTNTVTVTATGTGNVGDWEPIRPIGIVKKGVGRPRDDGTAGSALYRVPIRLSRPPRSSGRGSFAIAGTDYRHFHNASPGNCVGSRRHHRVGWKDYGEVGALPRQDDPAVCRETNEFEANRMEQERQRRERDDSACREHVSQSTTLQTRRSLWRSLTHVGFLSPSRS